MFICKNNFILFYVFFFFQAEDGIRDSSVTGVQTCALPIPPARGPPDLASVQPSGGPRAGGPSPRRGHLSRFVQPPRRVGPLLPSHLSSEGISIRGAAATGARCRGSNTLRSDQEP